MQAAPKLGAQSNLMRRELVSPWWREGPCREVKGDDMQNVAFMVQGLLENHTEGAQSVMDRHSEPIHAGRLKRGVATA